MPIMLIFIFSEDIFFLEEQRKQTSLSFNKPSLVINVLNSCYRALFEPLYIYL